MERIFKCLLNNITITIKITKIRKKAIIKIITIIKIIRIIANFLINSKSINLLVS